MKFLTFTPRAPWVGVCLAGLWFAIPQISIAQDYTLLQTLEGEVFRIVERVKPSVVTVVGQFSTSIKEPGSNEGLFGFFSDKPTSRNFSYMNIASGLVIDSTGCIVTKTSVVEGADSIRVKLSDGRTFRGELIGADPQSGLALIRIPDVKIQPPPISSEPQVRVGSWLAIVGNSLGVSPSVSVGFVNGLRNDGMIQLSGHLIPGNIGSPIFNSRGEVVGIVAGWVSLLDGVTSPEPVPYVTEGTIAYPIQTVLAVRDEVLAAGQQTGAWLGIEVRSDDQDGALVTSVDSGSPAERAGLQVGDRIVACNGRPLSDVRELKSDVTSAHPGEHFHLSVVRNGAPLDLEIVLGERPHPRLALRPGDHRVAAGYQGNAFISRGTYSPTDTRFLERRIRHLERELEALKTMLRKRP